MRTVAERLRHLKLRTKFLLAFAFIILLTILMISAVNFYVSINAIKRNTADYSEYLIGQIGINLEKRTQEIENLIFERFQRSSLSQLPDWIDNKDDPTAAFTRHTIVQQYLSDLLFAEDDFISVALIDSTGESYTLDRSTVLKFGAAAAKAIDLKRVEDARGKAVWFPGQGGVIMAKALYDVPSSKYVATAILVIESARIYDVYTQINRLTQGKIILFDNLGNPFVHPDDRDGLIDYVLENRLYEDGKAAKDGFEYDGVPYIFTVTYSPNGDWKIVQMISVRELTRGTEAIRYWTFHTTVLALFVGFLLAAFISKNITRHVRLLLKSMVTFSLDFSHRAALPRSRDEIGQLAEKFNQMADKIEELVQTVYKEKMLKQKAEYRTLQFEYKALQAQINPHFLYNTLESIYSLAMLKGEHEIGEMVYSLGRLLRESVGRKGDFIRLCDEISFIHNYLSIHKMIYGGKIEVKYDLDDRLDDCLVPKFLLQPLVENAVKHGIEEKPGKGVIGITARAEGGTLLLEVSDNGIGIDPQQAERLLNPPGADKQEENRDAQNSKHTNVGLISVHKRIRLLYGDDYGLTIASEKHVGTVVTVRMPVITEEGADAIQSGSH